MHLIFVLIAMVIETAVNLAGPLLVLGLVYGLSSALCGWWPFSSHVAESAAQIAPPIVQLQAESPKANMVSEVTSSGSVVDAIGFFAAGSISFFVLLFGVIITLAVLQELKKPFLGTSTTVFAAGTVILCAANGVFHAITEASPVKLIAYALGYIAIGVCWSVWPKHNLRRYRWRTSAVDAVYEHNKTNRELDSGVVKAKISPANASDFLSFWRRTGWTRGLPHGPISYRDPETFQRLIGDAAYWPASVIGSLFREIFGVAANKLMDMHRARYETATAEAAAADAKAFGTPSTPQNGGRTGQMIPLLLFGFLAFTLSGCGNKSQDPSKVSAEASSTEQEKKSPGLLDKLRGVVADKVHEKIAGTSAPNQVPADQSKPAQEVATTSSEPTSTKETALAPTQVPDSTVLPTSPHGDVDTAPWENQTNATSGISTKSFFEFFKLSSLGGWLLILASFVMTSMWAGGNKPQPYRAGFVVLFSVLLLVAGNGWYVESYAGSFGLYLGGLAGYLAVGALIFAPYMFGRVIRQRKDAIFEVTAAYIRQHNLVDSTGAFVKDLSQWPEHQAAVREIWKSSAQGLGFTVEIPDLRGMRTERVIWALFFPFIGVRLLLEDLIVNVWRNCIKACRASFERREAKDREFFASLFENPMNAQLDRN